MTKKYDNKAMPSTRIEIYKDESSKWHWALISKSQVRTQSPQGYVSKQGCQTALKTTISLMQHAELIEL